MSTLIFIMMIMGMAVGVATFYLGQDYYESRFEIPMPNIKIYRGMQVVIPSVAAGLFTWYGYDLLKAVQLVFLIALLLLAGKIDKHNRIIPNALIGVLMMFRILAFIIWFFLDRQQLASELTSGLCGFFVMTIIFSLLRLMYKQSIGMGDIKLMIVIGLYVGLMRSLYILLIAAIGAVVVSMVAMIKRRMTIKDSLSFGPSIALGGIVILIIGI